MNFLKKILSKFVKHSILATGIRKGELFSVNFKDTNNLVDEMRGNWVNNEQKHVNSSSVEIYLNDSMQ